jgi:hypothetical protein
MAEGETAASASVLSCMPSADSPAALPPAESVLICPRSCETALGHGSVAPRLACHELMSQTGTGGGGGAVVAAGAAAAGLVAAAGWTVPVVVPHAATVAAKRSLMVGVTEGCEVESGAGEEAVEEAGPVLHSLEPGLDQRGELAEVAFGQVGQGPLEVRPDRLNRLFIVRGALAGRVWARRLSAGRACFGWWSGLCGCGAAAGGMAGRRGWRGRGHPPCMAALTRVSERALWASFPEANRNDVLRLLSMLLERLAGSAAPTPAEGAGGEHGAGV